MTISPLTASSLPSESTRLRQSAEQFEALLVSQLLHTARDSAMSETLGPDSSAILDMADQQVAGAMAAGGGLGLSRLMVD